MEKLEEKQETKPRISTIEINESEANILFSGLDALIRNSGVNVSYDVLRLRDKVNDSFKDE